MIYAALVHRVAVLRRMSIATAAARWSPAEDRAGLEEVFERALRTVWIAFQPVVRGNAVASSPTRRSCVRPSRAWIARARPDAGLPVRQACPRIRPAEHGDRVGRLHL